METVSLLFREAEHTVKCVMTCGSVAFWPPLTAVRAVLVRGYVVYC